MNNITTIQFIASDTSGHMQPNIQSKLLQKFYKYVSCVMASSTRKTNCQPTCLPTVRVIMYYFGQDTSSLVCNYMASQSP